MRTCKGCGGIIPDSKRKQAIYCSSKCGNKHYMEWARGQYSMASKNNISQKVIASVAEMIVAVDLFRKGFEVYRQICQTSKFDLVACKDEKLYKIEVRSANRNKKTGNLYFCKKPHCDVDAIAAVLDENTIEYLPENWENL